jgi:tetratricopeptide (TPR) repeat protein
MGRWGAASARAALLHGAAALAVVFLVSLSGLSALAADLKVRGIDMGRFGRIALEFDKATKIAARSSNGVLVVAFAEPVKKRVERLDSELPAYVSVVRHDPDGTGMRLALTAPYRINVLEAGEKIFIDLLPENWTGMLPGLPPEVVAELARRAEEAEARVKQEALRKKSEGARLVKARVASLPTLTRIVFEPPDVVPVRFSVKGAEASIVFDDKLLLDQAQIAGQLAPAVRTFAVEEGRDDLQIRLVLESGYEARGFREDEAFVLDISKPQSAAAPMVPPVPPVLEPAKPAASDAPAKETNAGKPAAEPAREAARPTGSPEAPRARATEAAGPVAPYALVTAEGLRISFPFAGRVAAAAFERAGIVTAVFHTSEPLSFASLPAAAQPYAKLVEVVREGAFVIVRLALTKPQIARLAPQEKGWVLTIGEGHDTPLQPLPVSRSIDDNGRTVVSLPLGNGTGVHWIDDKQGERIAVVTAVGPPRGTTKLQRFVEFAVLPSIHGAAFAALADDVIVRTGVDGVTVSRGAGLTLSLPEAEKNPEESRVQRAQAVIQRDPWTQAQLGSARERARDLLNAAAEAPRSRRAAARMELAQVLLANDLNHEAASTLAFALQEDPGLQNDRPFLLLQGIAALGKGNIKEAKRIFENRVLGPDPEGVLWRASLDAAQRRWPQALTGFRRSGVVLDAYPESLQAALRLQAAQAAIEVRDYVYADSELTNVAPMVGSDRRNAFLLLRARLDEALGHPDVAVDIYRRLAETAERPVSAEATLRWVELALRHRMMDPAEAIPRLEILSVIWRGDEVELGTLGRLGRLYAEAGRWREAFLTARRANLMYADHEITRALHDEAARLFEDLFLSGKGDTLSRVEALALYFDFREFTPIGRRGDEIVRRLADRLVELDLLDQAANLLQHQVDNRLFGAARATVAARLATVRLMDGKPAQALEALRATRLPELPRSVNRARLLLEARALSDLSRTDLALEVLQGESGLEIDRLRADVLWSGRRWRDAGEAHEMLIGTRWQGREPLGDQDRIDVMRAAIAYSLAEDQLALDRVRAKFTAKMADSADARTFAFLTQPNAASTTAFRELARRVTSADTLADFLSEYRKRYPDAAAADRPRREGLPPEGTPAEGTPRPQAQGPAAPQPPRS